MRLGIGRYALMACLMLLPVHGAGAQQRAETPADMVFDIYRKGVQVGHHAIEFSRRGEDLTAETSIDIVVRVLGFAVYRYVQDVQEVWREGRMIALRSITDDDGDRFEVTGSLTPQGFVIRSGGREFVAPLGALPTTYWHPGLLQAERMIDTRDGEIRPVSIVPMGEEPVPTPDGTVTARMFRYDGHISFDFWRDARGQLLGLLYHVRRDGSVLRYRRVR